MTEEDLRRTRGARRSVRDLLADAQRRLAEAGVPSPSADATALACFVLDRPRGQLLLHDEVDDADRLRFESLLARRCSRVPLQHIVGTAAFRHTELQVGPGVFTPRPESELVAGAAIEALSRAEERIAVDLCTGSGALGIAIGLEVPGAVVYAVEIDDDACRWAAANVHDHRERLALAGSRVVLRQADATTCATGSLADLVGTVAVVVSNPPYIPSDAIPRDPEVRDHDPGRALYGGVDGLDVVRGVISTARQLLRRGGVVIIEHGDTQGDAAGAMGVPHLLSSEAGWTEVADHPDLTGRPRFTTATWCGDAGSS